MPYINLFGRNIPVNENNYDEIKYWNERRLPTSSDDVYYEKNLEFVKGQINAGDKVLDFGPGIGRLFPAYKKCSSVSVCDISLMYKDRLLENAKREGIPFKEFKHMTEVDVIPFAFNEFDVCVCSQVLLHQKPANIVSVLFEIKRVAKKVVCISSFEPGWFYDRPYGDTFDERRGCFNYNYPSLLQSLRMKVTYLEKFQEQLFFVFVDGEGAIEDKKNV